MARDKGYVTLGEIKAFYSSKEHYRRALDKLITFNVLIPDKGSKGLDLIFKRFNYNKFMEYTDPQKTLKEIGIE